MKTIFVSLFALSLLGCAAPSNKPVVDYKAMANTPEKYATLEADTKECANLAKKASTEGAGMAMWGAFAGDMRRANALEEKERVIASNCLRGRGYAVVY